MSAITGIWLLRAIAGSASASSWLGQATRTMSQPDAVSSAICCRVALTSAVSVVVIDCTEIGCSLPTPTEPTCSCRVFRRGRQGRAREGRACRGRHSRSSSSPCWPIDRTPLRRSRPASTCGPCCSWALCRVDECGSQVASSTGHPSASSTATTAGSSSSTEAIVRVRASRRSVSRLTQRAGRWSSSGRMCSGPVGRPCWPARLRQRAVPLGTAGQVDDVVLGLGGAQPVGALLEQRVAVRGEEERVPALRAGLQVVQAVPDVGEHAVDVEDGERPAARALGPQPCSSPHSAPSPEPDRVDDVRGQRQQAHRAADQDDEVGQRQQACVVHRRHLRACPAAPAPCRGPARRG